MGGLNSTLRTNISSEFERLKKGEREHLVLSEFLQLKMPYSDWSVDPSHLGVLFVLDSNKDGRFTIEKVDEFVKVATRQAKLHSPFEFKTKFQGFCTAQMWRCISAGNGKKVFVDWLTKLVDETGHCTFVETEKGEQRPEIQISKKLVYVGLTPVQTLYQVLAVEEVYDMDFQAFIDLLQRAGEAEQLMDLSDESLDEFVPLQVVTQFAASLYEGIVKFMSDIVPAHHPHTVLA